MGLSECYDMGLEQAAEGTGAKCCCLPWFPPVEQAAEDAEGAGRKALSLLMVYSQGLSWRGAGMVLVFLSSWLIL